MKLKLLFIAITLFALTFSVNAQNNWDADNAYGNFSYCNNWYSDNCPGTWNGTTDLLFQLRNNASQTSLYFDLGGWRDVQNLQFNSSYGQSTPLNGDGNGFNIYGKLENNSSWYQTINVPTSFKGSSVEINAVNADMVMNSIIYNNGNKAINIYGPNGKLLTFNNYIEGNSSVNMNIYQYSKVAIASDMTGKSPAAFSGGVNINIGELWINSGGKLNGGTITLGGNGNLCKLYINATDGTQVNNPIIVANNTGSTQIIGSFRNLGTNEYTGSVILNRDVTFETAGGGTTIFSGVISGGNNVAINNLTPGVGVATVVYNSTTTNTYTGTTTINAGTKLQISSNQTLGNINLQGGTLQVDAGKTLTITGTYSSIAGSIIDNKGTIKFAGGSVTFPGNATVNNGSVNTLSGFEAASTGTVTLNSLLHITNSVVVSAGILLLGGNDLRLNNATLSVATGGTFDNGGENQIINEGGTPTIDITGTFITRDVQGFVGTNTTIPSITPTLNAGSIVEYGLNGDQVVQGSTAPTYNNVTFSGSGTKTLVSANIVTGTITVKDAAIIDAGNHSFGGTGTKLTMTGTSEFKTAGTGVKPDAGGTYLLGIGTKMTFTNIAGTLESIRLSPIYYNIDIVGSSVGTNTSTGAIDFQSGATLIVKSSGTFKLSNTAGFSGGIQTAISSINNPTITLEAGSTIEYTGASQFITLAPVTTDYSNLTISGTGTKTLSSTELFVGNDLSVKASSFKIESGKTLTVTNKVAVDAAATMTFETDDFSQSGSLVQVNDIDTNSGIITYYRNVPVIRNTDYTYWSSPVWGQNLQAFSVKTPLNMFYSFDASALPEDWKQETPSLVTMGIGIGYCIYGPQITIIPHSFFPASFMGKPNNGKIDVPILWNNHPEGTSNLIGNPYPSAIDADEFLDFNIGAIEGTIYFWTHNTILQLASTIIANGATPGTGILAYTSDDYASYNKTGGTSASNGTGTIAPSGNTGGSNIYIPNGNIAAGQAFFTTSLKTTNLSYVTFKNSMRLIGGVSGINNSQFFKTRNPKGKTNTIEKHRIWLDLSNSQGAFKQTLVGYITDATNDYDNRFDGESIDGNEFVDFYSVNQDKNLVIQGRELPFDENDEVTLGFRTTIDGSFVININQTDGLLANQTVYLEDKLLNVVHNLKQSPYTFTTETGTFNDRFILRYTDKTLGNAKFEIIENSVLVSNKNKQIKINSRVETIDKVFVYDLLGKQIFKKEKVNSNELLIPNLVSSQQALLVKVSLQTGQVITKKIVY